MCRVNCHLVWRSTLIPSWPVIHAMGPAYTLWAFLRMKSQQPCGTNKSEDTDSKRASLWTRNLPSLSKVFTCCYWIPATCGNNPTPETVKKAFPSLPRACKISGVLLSHCPQQSDMTSAESHVGVCLSVHLVGDDIYCLSFYRVLQLIGKEKKNIRGFSCCCACWPGPLCSIRTSSHLFIIQQMSHVLCECVHWKKDSNANLDVSNKHNGAVREWMLST